MRYKARGYKVTFGPWWEAGWPKIEPPDEQVERPHGAARSE